MVNYPTLTRESIRQKEEIAKRKLKKVLEKRGITPE